MVPPLQPCDTALYTHTDGAVPGTVLLDVVSGQWGLRGSVGGGCDWGEGEGVETGNGVRWMI